MPKLQISLPDAPQVSHDLTDETVTIGRVDDNTVQIADASVSSHHAELVRSGEDYVLRDLDSTNGTRVNGRAVTEHALQDGDKVRFGNIEVAYVSENPSEALPLPATEEVLATPAAASERPTDFGNASPFRTKKKKKSGMANVVMGFAVLSILAFLAAAMMILTLQPPQ